MRDPRETAFEMSASPVRFGAGVTREIGSALADRGLRRALVVTDPVVARLPPAQAVVDSLEAARVGWRIYDRVRVEPSEDSWLDAIADARREPFDAIVTVGGGSTIDTAKAVNLYTAHPPADFLDYVNAPIGRGLPVPGALPPLFAIPTTAGTGSETTGVAICDLPRLHVKTGISSRRLKPVLGFLDPDHTRTLAPAVAASAGLDVLCHAVESYTAIPFTDRLRPPRPSARPTYQGANPISDVWALQAMRMTAAHLVRLVDDPGDDEARAAMVLAASFAGIGDKARRKAKGQRRKAKGQGERAKAKGPRPGPALLMPPYRVGPIENPHGRQGARASRNGWRPVCRRWCSEAHPRNRLARLEAWPRMLRFFREHLGT